MFWPRAVVSTGSGSTTGGASASTSTGSSSTGGGTSGSGTDSGSTGGGQSGTSGTTGSGGGTSTTTITTTITASEVSTVVTLTGLDFDKVVADEAVKAELVTSIKNAFLDSMTGYTKEDLIVVLTKGSVKATATINQ